MKTKNLLLYSLVFFIAPFIASAQDSTKTFTLSGSVDVYAHTSLGTTSAAGYAPTTSFSNLRGFSLGMVNLIGSYAGEKVGFTADIVFGPRGYDAVFANTYTSQRIVNQMFAYLKLGKAVTVNLGQFNTFVGYEVISPTLNFNYSTSYMFSYGPFNHTGLRVDFASESGFVAKLAIMNPTDFVEFNPTKSVTLGGQVGFTGEKGGVWFNVLYGDQDGKLKDSGDLDSEGTLFQADLTTGWNLSDAFYLGLNTTYRTLGKGQAVIPTAAPEKGQGFMGVALYPKVTLSESFALGLRAEYFSVNKGYITPFTLDSKGNGSVVDLTLSGNIKVGGLTLIPEARIDVTSEKSYADSDGKATAMIPSLTMAAVYKF
jgi:hypothetical protein